MENNIIKRHQLEEGRLNLTSLILEIDTRLILLEQAMGYLAEAERNNSKKIITFENSEIIKPGEEFK